MLGHYQSAEAAYWAFFETFNARSAAGRAGVMSYPHIRISAARVAPAMQATAEEFGATASWKQVDRSGWARTQPITPRVVHSSSDKVHFAGGWTRYRADGSLISSNRLLYIATKMSDGWGIQAGFGIEGYLSGDDAAAPSKAAMGAIEQTMTTLEAGDVDAWLDCFHYPMTIVLAPGQLEVYSTRESMEAAYREWASAALPISYEASVIAAVPSGALVEQAITHGAASFEQVFLVVERDGVWATSAVSAVQPDI